MENIRVRRSVPGDIPAIQSLLRTEPKAVLEVDAKTLETWIGLGMSLVAVERTNGAERIVGHQGASIWPEEAVGIKGLVEFRSAVIHPDHRGNGLNMQMKGMLLDMLAEEHPELTRVVVLKNSVSNGTNILFELGFAQADPRTLPKAMLDLGGDQNWKVYTKSLTG